MEVGTQQQPSNSLKGPRDASVVRSARAQAGYHRRSPSVTRSHWPAFGKWPSPQRQLKKKSPTSSCLETVGYVVTARNPVPPISLFLPDPKGSLRFAPGFHPTSNPFCARRAGDFHSNFFGFWPPRGKACYYFIYLKGTIAVTTNIGPRRPDLAQQRLPGTDKHHGGLHLS